MQEALPYKKSYGVGWGAGKAMAEAIRAAGGNNNSDDDDRIGVGDGESNNNNNNNKSVMVGGGIEGVEMKVSENAVMVFGRSGCCMCHVVKRLLLGVGANPPVFEVADDADEARLLNQLTKLMVVAGSSANSASASSIAQEDEDQLAAVNKLKLPLVFVGGEYFGGLDRVMATHISGELVPILRRAGAIWL
ncbi:hypothetical protein Dimus_032702 [Dionaea muscipula]